MVFQAAGIGIDEGSYGEENGGTVGQTDYPMVTDFWKYLLYSYRNSIGDINPPVYGYWMKNAYCDPQYMPNGAKYDEFNNYEAKCAKYELASEVMIYVVWFVWWIN